MKKLFLFLFAFSLLGLYSPEVQAIGFSSEPSVAPFIEAPATLSNKELREQRKLERKTERRQKWAQRLEKFAPNALEGNLRYALLAAVAAIVLSVAGFIIGFAGIGVLGYLLGVLAGLAWLAAVVFLVLWLIDEIG